MIKIKIKITMQLMNLPPEIINHIFCYCQGSTNQIMKQCIEFSNPIDRGIIGVKRINLQYGFIHLNITRLIDTICYRCPVCKNRLLPNQWIQNINYEEQRMCSYSCLNEYEAAMTLVHMRW